MWPIHTMEYYSALKRKGILALAATGMSLEDMMLSEINQTQKDKYRVVPLTGVPWRSQIHRDRKEKSGCQGLGGGEWGPVSTR